MLTTSTRKVNQNTWTDVYRLSCYASYSLGDGLGIRLLNGNSSTVFSQPSSGTTASVSTNLTPNERHSFLEGQMTLQVLSSSCPNGALGGQLTVGYNGYSLLRDNQNNNNIFVGITAYDVNSEELQSIIVHRVNNPTTAGIFVAENDESAAFTYAIPASPVNQRFTYINAREFELYHRQQYNEIFSGNQNGASGSIIPTDAIPEVSFAFTLQSSSGTNNYGIGLFAVYCDGDVEYFIQHNVSDTLFVGVYQRGGNNNNLLFSLDGVRSPVAGTFTLTEQSQVDDMLDGNYEVRVLSASRPQGDISGVVRQQYPYYAFLSGTQLTSPLATASRGIALFDIIRKENAPLQLTYTFTNMVEDATSVDLFFGRIQEDGLFYASLPFQYNFQRYSQGNTQIPINEQIEDGIQSGQTYVVISGYSVPSGEIRGQILPAYEPCVNLTASLLYLDDDDMYSTDFFQYIPAPPPPNSASSLSICSLLLVTVILLVVAA